MSGGWYGEDWNMIQDEADAADLIECDHRPCGKEVPESEAIQEGHGVYCSQRCVEDAAVLYWERKAENDLR